MAFFCSFLLTRLPRLENCFFVLFLNAGFFSGKFSGENWWSWRSAFKRSLIRHLPSCAFSIRVRHLFFSFRSSCRRWLPLGHLQGFQPENASGQNDEGSLDCILSDGSNDIPYFFSMFCMFIPRSFRVFYICEHKFCIFRQMHALTLQGVPNGW